MHPFVGELWRRQGLRITLIVPVLGAQVLLAAGWALTGRPAVAWAAAILGILCAAWWVERRLVRPLHALIAAATGFANADPKARVPVMPPGELSDLASQMASAAKRLNATVAALRRETQRERAILAAIGEGVLVADPQGRIVVINTAAYGIIGQAEAERLQNAAQRGEAGHQFYAALEAVQPALERALGRSTADPPRRLVLAGRTYRLNAQPIWLDQELLGAVASLHDISAAVESELLRNDFIAVAAHELRTPLTSIRGFLDLLQFTDLTTLSPEQRQCLDVINRSTLLMRDLINDLLDLSRLDQHQAQVVPRPLRLAQALDDALLLLREQARSGQITLTAAIANDLPPLRLDPAHIARILSNVLSNAIKYTPAGGAVHVSLQRRGDEALISVRDTGIGIPERDQPRIFGRFFRAEHPLSAEIGGTGLGLAITKSLVELNHGMIHFESREGHGTTFFVSFPLALACELLEPVAA